jgi:hypothetical protein
VRCDEGHGVKKKRLNENERKAISFLAANSYIIIELFNFYPLKVVARVISRAQMT